MAMPGVLHQLLPNLMPQGEVLANASDGSLCSTARKFVGHTFGARSFYWSVKGVPEAHMRQARLPSL